MKYIWEYFALNLPHLLPKIAIRHFFGTPFIKYDNNDICNSYNIIVSWHQWHISTSFPTKVHNIFPPIISRWIMNNSYSNNIATKIFIHLLALVQQSCNFPINICSNSCILLKLDKKYVYFHPIEQWIKKQDLLFSVKLQLK